jgi:tRNA dimethylallyltransferase
MKKLKYDIIFIVGPTSIGKTEVSLSLAKKINAEIISADSMQIYKFIDIGTSKPKVNAVKYHLIDFIPLNEKFNVYKYFNLALKYIREITGKNKTVIISGGTGLYIEAILNGIFTIKTEDSDIRNELELKLKKTGILHLFKKLQDVDPESAEIISSNDKQRIIRALQVFYTTGEKISQLQQKTNYKFNFPYIIIGLTCNRILLYNKIENDVIMKLKNGWIDEVKNLISSGYEPELKRIKPIGYLQIINYLNGLIDYEDLKHEIIKITKNYAKRQITWFKRYKQVNWLARTFDLETDLNNILNFI